MGSHGGEGTEGEANGKANGEANKEPRVAPGTDAPVGEETAGGQPVEAAPAVEPVVGTGAAAEPLAEPEAAQRESTVEAEAAQREATAEPVMAREPVAEADVAAGPVVAAEVEPAREPPRRSRVWLWIVGLLIAAAIVGSVIGGNLGGRQGGPLANQTGGSGRPTIVVATVVAAPSVAAVASPSVVAAASPVVAGPTASTAPSTTYTVQPGDTLQSIAEDQYGDAGMWPRIYQANRDLIGPDPDNLVAGTKLTLPH